MGKAHVFWRDRHEFEPAKRFAKLFFSFSNLIIRIGKAFIFNKNEGKVENKVLGKFRESFIVPIRWLNHLIIWIKMYTQYVIIAYGFIMYYNTEVQVIATIWNK